MSSVLHRMTAVDVGGPDASAEQILRMFGPQGLSLIQLMLP